MQVRYLTLGPYAAASATAIATGQIVAANGLFTLASTTMDTPRRLLISSSGNDTGVTFTITGTTFGQSVTTETIVGSSGGTVLTVTDWATIATVRVNAGTSTVSLGTSAVNPGGSAWMSIDNWALGSTFLQCSVYGTINYTIQTTTDDPNLASSGVTVQSVVWDSTLPGVVNATAMTSTVLSGSPEYVRLLCNSYTAGAANYVKMGVNQAGSVPY